jgi:hypothetical protein
MERRIAAWMPLKRLLPEARSYILCAKGSYSAIQHEVETRWGRRPSKGILSYYRGSRTGRSKQAHLAEVSPSDWDWLVGLYYADGCKFRDAWKYVCVFTLATSERYILDKLLAILRIAGLTPSVRKKAGRNALDVRTYNKDLFESLSDKSQNYEPRVPLAYVAGLFDGDGHISESDKPRRWIFSQAKYPHLAHQTQRILSTYGKITLRSIRRQEGWLTIYRVSVLKDARKTLGTSEFARNCVRLSVVSSGYDRKVVPRA